MATAMVWGAAGGIGRALVSELMNDDWEVAAVSHHVTDKSDDDQSDDDAIQDVAIALTADVSDEFSVQQAVMAAAQHVADVTLWVYSVGDILSRKTAESDYAEWQRMLDANLTGAYLAARHSLPLLSDDAHMVFLGARHERLRLPGLGAYAAAKAGLEAFVEALAKEERRKRFTIVRPGAVDTPLWDKVPLRLPKDAMTPQAVAADIVAAHVNGFKGTLDLG